MRMLWAHREINVPAGLLWELLTDIERWPDWGPSVRAAELDGGRIETGARGTVTSVLGVELPFVITGYEPSSRWSWKVAGVAATDHSVEPISANRCRVGFGVPWPAAAYLAVCRIALGRLAAIAEGSTVTG